MATVVSVEGAGVPLAALDREGSDPSARTTVFVHGMGGTWWPLDTFAGRVVTYDRRGYGGSGAPVPFDRTTVQEQTEDLAAVVDALGAAPAVLVGADFGALVVLDALQRHPTLASGAVLVDPPVYMFVAEATEALSERVAELEAELRSGGPAALEAARARIADFSAITSLPITHAGLAAIGVPVAVVVSEGAPHHDLAAAEALLDAMPAAVAAPDLASAVRRAGGG